MKLVEIHDIDPNTRNIRTNDVYTGTPRQTVHRVGESRILNDIAQRRAWSKKNYRKRSAEDSAYLINMVDNNIREFKQVEQPSYMRMQ